MTHLIQCLEVADPTANLDSDCSTIWCLAHIIHLAAMEILVHLKAVKQADVRAMGVDLAINLMQEEAEMLEPEKGGEEPNILESNLGDVNVAVSGEALVWVEC